MRVLNILGLVSGVLTIRGWSLRDVPWFQSFWSRVRLPYWAWNSFLFWQRGVSPLSLDPTSTNFLKTEKFLYALVGVYRRIGINAGSLTLLGTPAQFCHNSKAKIGDYSTSFLTQAQKYFSEDEYIDIYIIWKL